MSCDRVQTVSTCIRENVTRSNITGRKLALTTPCKPAKIYSKKFRNKHRSTKVDHHDDYRETVQTKKKVIMLEWFRKVHSVLPVSAQGQHRSRASPAPRPTPWPYLPLLHRPPQFVHRQPGTGRQRCSSSAAKWSDAVG